MSDELVEYYDLLGLSPGASPEELKLAHRDLAKVWHPDRFLHDPRLRDKAQEKLKLINEAYDQLRSGRVRRPAQRPASTSEQYRAPTPPHYATDAKAGDTLAARQRIRWPLIVAPILIFAAVFLIASRSLLHSAGPDGQSQVPATEESQVPAKQERQQAPVRSDASAIETSRSKAQKEPKSQRTEPDGAATNQPGAAPVRAMATVTVVIDPSSGMIARSDCPNKARMTYPSGSEPHQVCTLVHRGGPTAQTDTAGAKDSRIKAAAKRIASPGKWFGGKDKTEAGDKQEPKTP